MTEQTAIKGQRRLFGVATATAVVLLLVLVTYSTVSYWHLQHIYANQDRVRSATVARGAVNRLLTALQDAETGQRGYLLTGEAIFLKPYQTALGTIEQTQRELQEFLSDEPEQLSRLDKLRSQIDANLAELAETLQVAREKGLDEARKNVSSQRGLQEMDAARGTLAAIGEAESQRRESLRDAADVSIHYAVASLGISTVFSCAIIAIGFYVVQREMAARRRLAEFLQTGDRNKDEFLATLGHELRNPLAAIRNAIEVLGLLGTLPESVDEMRAIIGRQTNLMGRLVDDLLDTSRIAHGKIELRKTRLELVELVDRIVTDMRTAIHGADVTIAIASCEKPIWVRGDATRLAQAVGNLLHNAIKFSRQGDRVLVQITVVNSSNLARIVIADEGIGMDRTTLDNVFEPFAQGQANGDRSHGGLGLGLPLAKGLIELHGGQITAHSGGPGRGTTFAILLPLDQHATPREEGNATPLDSSASCRVLIIDDRRDALYPLQRMLELGGHEVRGAADGATGVELARSMHPDVVMCDIGLPGGISGYEVARALRGSPETSSLYLVALTAYGDEEARRKAFEAGFDRHVTKPASLADLREILSAIACGRTVSETVPETVSPIDA